MKTNIAVAAERTGAFIALLITTEVTNLLLGTPLDSFQVAGLTFVFAAAAKFAGFGVGRGLVRSKFAASEEYGEAAAAHLQKIEKEKNNG